VAASTETPHTKEKQGVIQAAPAAQHDVVSLHSETSIKTKKGKKKSPSTKSAAPSDGQLEMHAIAPLEQSEATTSAASMTETTDVCSILVLRHSYSL
jgi:hypothetical protein